MSESAAPRSAVPVDTVGAFVGGPTLVAIGDQGAPLSGTTFAAKDLFDVTGMVTGAGSPDLAAERSPATVSASAVRTLVRAGSTLVGKTVTDELAYSLVGTNPHFGTPANTAAPGHVPGGSSSGSAAAVAAGLVDLALGTDTGGSIRVPASYCGIYGWRPTHGSVPIDGVTPLAPSFDTVGLLAKDPVVLRRAAETLLGEDAPSTPTTWKRIVLAEESLQVADPDVIERVLRAADQLGERLELSVERKAIGIDLDEAADTFRILQGFEAWAIHGEWILTARPNLGRGVAQRFRAASEITTDEFSDAQWRRADIAATLSGTTEGGTLLVQPATPFGPLALDADHDAQAAARPRLMELTAPAGLAGAPVVVIPMERRTASDLPVGLAMIGPAGSDLDLLALAVEATGPSDL